MAQFLSLNGRYLMTCPYNPSHTACLITKEEINAHLESCRMAHFQTLAAEGRAVDFHICFFNPAHQIPTIEIDLHQILCEDSYSVELGEVGSQEVEYAQEADFTANACESEEMAENVAWVENDCAGKQVGSNGMPPNQINEHGEGFNLEESNCNVVSEELEQVKDNSDKSLGIYVIPGKDPFTGLALQE